MKKLVVLIVVLVLTACMVFSACSSVDPIIGVWEISVTNTNKSGDEVEATMSYIFHKDGTHDTQIMVKFLSGDKAG
ncbi:MAG: hypothetical protein RR873_05135, partial [Christensenella sp.]